MSKKCYLLITEKSKSHTVSYSETRILLPCLVLKFTTFIIKNPMTIENESFLELSTSYFCPLFKLLFSNQTDVFVFHPPPL